MAWRERPEAGAMWSLRLVEWLAQVFGRRFVFAVMHPVAWYFYCVRRDERAAIEGFLKHALRREPQRREVFANFLAFAKVTVDRVFIMAGKDSKIRIRYFGTEPLVRMVDAAKGGVFLAAHFGSFESARMIAAEHPQVRMRIVVDSEVNPNFMARMAEIDPEFARSIIDPHQTPAALGVEIAAALRDSQWVGFLADRVFEGERLLRCELFEQPVVLPAGPFTVAAAFKAPVIGIFPVFTDNGYDVYFELLTTGLATSRESREQDLAAFAQRYLECLEKYARQYPDNWFNFYDYFALPANADTALS